MRRVTMHTLVSMCHGVLTWKSQFCIEMEVMVSAIGILLTIISEMLVKFSHVDSCVGNTNQAK